MCGVSHILPTLCHNISSLEQQQHANLLCVAVLLGANEAPAAAVLKTPLQGAHQTILVPKPLNFTKPCHKFLLDSLI